MAGGVTHDVILLGPSRLEPVLSCLSIFDLRSFGEAPFGWQPSRGLVRTRNIALTSAVVIAGLISLGDLAPTPAASTSAEAAVAAGPRARDDAVTDFRAEEQRVGRLRARWAGRRAEAKASSAAVAAARARGEHVPAPQFGRATFDQTECFLSLRGANKQRLDLIVPGLDDRLFAAFEALRGADPFAGSIRPLRHERMEAQHLLAIIASRCP